MLCCKNTPARKFNNSSTRFQNSSLLQKNVGENVGVALVCSLQHVGVDVGRGAHLGVPQPFGNAHTVHPVEVQHRGHCMPERMGVDVWEIVPPAELLEPVRHAVRVHGVAVVLRKYEVLVLVVFPQSEPFLCLPRPIPPQQLHGFRWQCHIAPGAFGFGCALIDAHVGAIENIVADVNAVPFKVHLVPFQSQHFPAPCAGNEKQVNKHFPLHEFHLLSPLAPIRWKSDDDILEWWWLTACLPACSVRPGLTAYRDRSGDRPAILLV